MPKQFSVRFTGEEEKIYNAVEKYFNRGPARLTDSQILRACVRYFYEHEVPSESPGEKK
ncbi:MAG: hypothetical protein ACFFB3_11710 [Candidatus Hodarchaeota archaeon]